MKCSEVRFSSLIPEWQALIRAMQKLNFGHLDYLVVEDRVPRMEKSIIAVAEYRFNGSNGPSPEYELDDFTLKQSMIDFIDEIQALGNAIVDTVSVKHGLPFKMEVERPLSL